MQNKKIKKFFSTVFVVGFIFFIFMIDSFENSKLIVKTDSYKTKESLKENKYGLYLSSFHANLTGDFVKLSSIYPAAIEQNKDDFLGKQLILKSISDEKNDTLLFALNEHKKNKNNIIPVMYIANNYFLKGDYQKAYNLYNNMNEKANTFIVKLLRSWILIAEKKYDDALDLLETEIDNQAFRKYALTHLAAQAEIAKDYDYADELYEELLSSENLNIFDIENMVAFYLKNNNKKKAVEILKDYYEKTPDSMSSLSLLSKVRKDLYKPQSIDTAKKGMAKALFDVSFLLSSVFTSYQDLHLMYLSMINDLYPELYMSYIIQAEIYKKYSKTVEVHKYLDLIPENHYLYLIAQTNKVFYDFKIFKNNKKAQDSFNNLIKKYPTYTHLYLKLGNYYQNKKNYKKALQNYSKALSLTENKQLRANIYYARAQVYDILKDIKNTEIDLESSFTLNNKKADFLNYYGYFLIQNNIDLDKGMLLISNAVIQNPTNPYYLDSYGWALFKKGDFEKALTSLQFAKSIQPKNPVIVDHLGDVYWNLNRKREAIFEWNKVLGLKNLPEQEQINFNHIEYKINYGL